MTATGTPLTQPAHRVTLTEAAADKARRLIERDGTPGMKLRMAVQPGGCSGLRYELFFDDRTLAGDEVVEFDGVPLVVDQMSKPYVDGATIDYRDTIEKQGFSIDNPNAGNSCACGDSFH
jgi:iron-sulfur cluster assembly accessory protein